MMIRHRAAKSRRVLAITAVVAATVMATVPARSGQSAQSTTATAALTFDGARALDFVRRQVESGPRVPGSTGLLATRKLILDELGACGFTTGTQAFSGRSALMQAEVEGLNVFAVFPPGARPRDLLTAHYDTRPRADMERNPRDWMRPVPGANDGGSGVAVLLELARVISANPPVPGQPGVAMAFFDLEDHGLPTKAGGFCMGSAYMAANLPPQLAGFKAGVNLDMVGDADLSLPAEINSLNRAPGTVKTLWGIGREMYPAIFRLEGGMEVYDDHVPFQEAGYDFVDVIDFTYKPWHTLQDTTDKCSAPSLKAVGDVLARYVARP